MFVLCRLTNFIPLFSQGISINYKNDFMLTGCCQGQTVHPLSIPAAPERVLFVYRRLEIQWEIRFFAIPAPANRNFGRATIHMIEYLWVLRGFYHGWRCPSRVFIKGSEKLVGFQKKVSEERKNKPPEVVGSLNSLFYLLLSYRSAEVFICEFLLLRFL